MIITKLFLQKIIVFLKSYALVWSTVVVYGKKGALPIDFFKSISRMDLIIEGFYSFLKQDSLLFKNIVYLDVIVSFL
ncbi:hypothetical protein L1275_002384 [Flavobacterium sp. HSC-61S13]|nr:hypothetical protein [Flavobacterium sp. HSC-61S13]